MDTFSLVIAGWHDFYIMTGTAAATLMGLLFVSLSLNVDIITRDENDDLRILASQSFVNFLCVLMFSVVFLIPSQVPAGLGLPLLGIGGFGLYYTLSRYLHTRKNLPRSWGKRSLTMRFVLPIICYATLSIIAISVLMSMTDGLYWLVPVMILLIINTSINAWDLLLRLRNPAKGI
jgi:hypothetical protein